MSEKVGKIYVKDQKEEGEGMRAAIDNEVTSCFMFDFACIILFHVWLRLTKEAMAMTASAW